MRVSSSRSLWNYALSPGWTPQEVEILKIALMKYGIGRWKKIVASECLPTKNIGQLYMQTQRLLGQQSLAEFVGLHIDLESVFLKNMELRNDKNGRAQVKNGLLVNMGDNYTRAEIEKKRRENIRRFGLSCDYYMSLNPPKAKTKEWLKVLTIDQILRDKTRFSVSQKIHQLEILKIALKKKLRATLKFKVYKNCNIGIVINRIDKSIHAHEAEYEYVEETLVESKAL